MVFVGEGWEQEGDSDVGCVNFEVLEGHPSRDVQKAWEFRVELEDLGTWIRKTGN